MAQSLDDFLSSAYSSLVEQRIEVAGSRHVGPLSQEQLTAALEQLRGVATEVSRLRLNNERLASLCEQAVSQYEQAVAARDEWHRRALSTNKM